MKKVILMLLELTAQTFDMHVLSKKGYVIVDFWASWCNACRGLESVLEELEETYIDKLSIYKVNVETHMDLADRFDVMNLPTLLLFKNGEVVSSIFGMQSMSQLQTWLNL